MKESGMDKLIKLLNEYEGNKLYFYDDGIYCDKYDMYEVGDSLVELEIISKRYGFIQRLVKHFMFNMTKIDARIALSDFNATDRMLMALAISDNPIEFLISILK